MGQWWRHGLGVIAVITGGALAIMNVLGCISSFDDCRIQYGAAGVGLCADIGIVCLMLGFRDFRHKKRWLALLLAVPLWVAASGYTVVQGAKWLEHAFETAQQPAQKQKLTEEQRQEKLRKENALLDDREKTATHEKDRELRANAHRLAAETRGRIAELEKLNTFAPPEVKPTPIQSPFSGYEQWITFILWLSSQACWFMAYGESEETEEAEIGKPERGETPIKNGAPLPGKRQRKQGGNGKRKPAETEPGNGEGAKIYEFWKRPTKEEINAFTDRNLSDGNDKWEGAEAHFGYSVRHLRNILNEKSGSQAA
jgi:hypothetical protein